MLVSMKKVKMASRLLNLPLVRHITFRKFFPFYEFHLLALNNEAYQDRSTMIKIRQLVKSYIRIRLTKCCFQII